MKCKEWFPEWLEHYAQPVSKQKTYSRYSKIVSQHILPVFGDMLLEDITPIVLQKYITELMETGNLRTENLPAYGRKA